MTSQNLADHKTTSQDKIATNAVTNIPESKNSESKIPELKKPEPKTSANRGSRNLMILGIGAIVLTGITTSLSLFIYRSSGDIYLDRSRPGYLPDEEEVTEESDVSSGYAFSENGELTADDLDQYLKEYQEINQRLQNISADAYDPDPLADSSLGIPSELKED